LQINFVVLTQSADERYWSPAIKELRQRVFNALGELEKTLSL